MSDDTKHFQMWWDCPQCQATGLLGLTHRHCPQCGTAQDARRRYFPPEGQELEAKQHRFVGADWQCSYCHSPNAANAKFCINCSAGQDGSKPVALVRDGDPRPSGSIQPPEPLPVAKQAARPSRPWGWMLAGLGALALFIGLVVMFNTTRDNAVTLVDKTWERSIRIERLNEVRDSAWCDSMPSDAYGVRPSREVRSHKQVADGQDCSEIRVDNGDGSFSKQRSCSTRYREEPVYDMRCSYKLMRWQTSRRLVSNQLSQTEPAWPILDASVGPPDAKKLGAERKGGQSETYTLTLHGQKPQDNWTCEVSHAVWAELKRGHQLTLPVRLLGGAACARLH
ncbi:hypothetical protein [Roseateles sp.]|uniref:hypothetical protein n=1 Tax=Roseateles sp. TaxID=1971397 RepID=UPI003BA6D506